LLLIYLQGSREQLAIAEFAASLLIIPKTLAINAAKDSSDLVAKLRSYHAASQTSSQNAIEPDPKKKNYKNYGLDLTRGKVHDEVKAGVLEPSMSKIRSLVSHPQYLGGRTKLLTVI